MKADKEFIEYIQKRSEYFHNMIEETQEHEEDEYRCIFYQGAASAMREVLNVLDDSVW